MHTSTETDSRWSSESPLGFAAGDTNLQRYVGNSPTNYTDPTGLWREGGHFYTVYNMGRLSGLDHNRARELAYYAQYPDEVDAYDAVFVASPHGPDRWHDAGDAVGTHYENINGQRWEELIQRDLHQLHGGDMPEIHKRREHLKKLFNEAMGECDYKFAGVILHALGDSFAHTYLDRHGRRRAFDSAVGHGTALGPLTGTWQGGKAVDKIRERYADNAYPDYIDFLADLLGVSDADALLDPMRPTLAAR